MCIYSFVSSFFLYWGSHSTNAAIYSFDGYFDSICFFCFCLFIQVYFFKANCISLNSFVFLALPMNQWTRLCLLYWKCIGSCIEFMRKYAFKNQTKKKLCHSNRVTSLCFNLKQHNNNINKNEIRTQLIVCYLNCTVWNKKAIIAVHSINEYICY